MEHHYFHVCHDEFNDETQNYDKTQYEKHQNNEITDNTLGGNSKVHIRPLYVRNIKVPNGTMSWISKFSFTSPQGPTSWVPKLHV